MEGVNLNDNGVESKKNELEIEEARLAQNSEEIYKLLTEDVPLTEKAKLLLAQVGKVTGGVITGAGIAGTLGSMGLSAVTIYENMEGMLVDIPPNDALFLITALGLSGFVSLLGMTTFTKFEDVANKIKGRISEIKQRLVGEI